MVYWVFWNGVGVSSQTADGGKTGCELENKAEQSEGNSPGVCIY